MRCEFNEKLYEILVSHELLTNGYGLGVPSQKEENHLGFDSLVANRRFQVCCLQYKIPECTKNQREIWGGQEVFKFYAYKDKKWNSYAQHNLLVKANKHGIPAYYCAPYFLENSELYNYSAHNSLLANSALLKPIHRLLTPERHVIEFDRYQAYQFCDNGEEIKLVNHKEMFSESELFSIEEFTRVLTEEMQLDQTEEESIDSILAKCKMTFLFRFYDCYTGEEN